MTMLEADTLLSVIRALSYDNQARTRDFLRRVASVIGADMVGSCIRRDQWLVPLQGYRLPADRLEVLRQPLSIDHYEFYAQGVWTKRAMFSRDARLDPRIPDTLRQAVPYQGELFLPIVVRDRVIGGLVAAWLDRPPELSARDLVFVESLAAQVGAALEKAPVADHDRRTARPSAAVASEAKAGLLFVEPDIDFLSALLPFLEPHCEIAVALTKDAAPAALPEHMDVAFVRLVRDDPGSELFLAALCAKYGCPIVLSGSSPEANRLAAAEIARANTIFLDSPAVADVWACLTMSVPALSRRRLGRPVLNVAQQAATRNARDLSPGMLADHLGISHYNLARQFQSDAGMTIRDYLKNVAMWRARLLLCVSRDKLEAIAERSGFFDASHLSRVFRELTGMRPGEYRRRAREMGCVQRIDRIAG
jgi:AraC-like DNA-binding protein